MKNIFIALIFLTTGLVKAQDSIGIDSTLFNIQSTNYYLDTLDFTYYLNKTGAATVENITTFVNVNPGTGANTDSVQQTVLNNTAGNTVDFSVPYPSISNRLVLKSAVFKNGNNTVVIWPDNNNLNSINEIKVDIFVSGYESVGPSPLLEKVNVKNYDSGLLLENKEDNSVTLRIFELTGKIVKVLELGPHANKVIDLKEGVYFVTLLQGNSYYLHKTQVLR
tara:strand:- start:75 stop:740 length:666 start_codon:yes stop_codon:yes gene_type:complete